MLSKWAKERSEDFVVVFLSLDSRCVRVLCLKVLSIFALFILNSICLYPVPKGSSASHFVPIFDDFFS